METDVDVDLTPEQKEASKHRDNVKFRCFGPARVSRVRGFRVQLESGTEGATGMSSSSLSSSMGRLGLWCPVPAGVSCCPLWSCCHSTMVLWKKGLVVFPLRLCCMSTTALLYFHYGLVVFPALLKGVWDRSSSNLQYHLTLIFMAWKP